jgi:hypothetical protein
MVVLGEDDLTLLEAAVEAALRSGDETSLRILGYGEISLVLAWPTDSPRVAAKRLPVFGHRHRAEAYGALIVDYLEALRERGVEPLDSGFAVTPTADGRSAAYVVQPVLEADRLAPAVLSTADDGGGRRLLAAIVDLIVGGVDERVGVDGQLSNWAATPDGLRYLDVTTPMLTDARGETRLDLTVLTSPLPALVRPGVRRWVAPGIAARYHRRRDVLVDLAANLLKERLERWVDPTIEAANRHLERPIDRAEVDRYYRADARLWELMWRLRRADRRWQRAVRRRPYPTLLPGRVER